MLPPSSDQKVIILLFIAVRILRRTQPDHWFSLYTFSTPTAVYHSSFSRDIKIYTIHSITFSESTPSNLSSYCAARPPPSCYRTFRVACCHFSKKEGEETTQKVRHCPL